MIKTAYLPTTFGYFEITGSEKGIRSVQLTDNKTAPHIEVPKELENCFKQLKEYFDGERSHFDIKLDLSGHTEFNQSVWQELLKVPHGRTTTYLKIAENIDNPKAVRAVGLANKNNPIAIIVPCHRCIASSGKLQGYFYGLDMKRKLLELENPMSFAQQGSLF